jgi:hypothetical protein
MSEKHFGSFAEFWPHYVRAHSNKTNRQLHFLGITLAVACAAGGVFTRRPLLVLAAPIVGYGLSWVGHYVFEKNTPATFEHPVWSLKADFVMWTKIANGTMDAEVERVAKEHGGEGTADEAANGAPVEVTAN